MSMQVSNAKSPPSRGCSECDTHTHTHTHRHSDYCNRLTHARWGLIKRGRREDWYVLLLWYQAPRTPKSILFGINILCYYLSIGLMVEVVEAVMYMYQQRSGVWCYNRNSFFFFTHPEQAHPLLQESWKSIANQWGNICYSGFSKLAADSACRQLGLRLTPINPLILSSQLCLTIHCSGRLHCIIAWFILSEIQIQW